MAKSNLKLLPSAEDFESRDRRQAEVYRELERDIGDIKVWATALQDAVMGMDEPGSKEEEAQRMGLGILMANLVEDKAETLYKKYHAV